MAEQQNESPQSKNQPFLVALIVIVILLIIAVIAMIFWTAGSDPEGGAEPTMTEVSLEATASITASAESTQEPTATVTESPTEEATDEPTLEPTLEPTAVPTEEPPAGLAEGCGAACVPIPACGIQAGLRIEAVVNRVDHHLDVTLRLHVAAHHAKRPHRLTVSG